MEHGTACAMALPCVVDYNWAANPAKFADVAAAVDEGLTGGPREELAAQASATVRRLLSDLGVPAGLKAWGATPETLDSVAVASAAAGYEQWNPRPTDVHGFRSILACMTGL